MTSSITISKKRVTFAASVAVDSRRLSSLPRTPVPTLSSVDGAYSDSGNESGCESTGSTVSSNIPSKTSLGTLDCVVEKEALVCPGLDNISGLYGAISTATSSHIPSSSKSLNQSGLIGLGVHFASPLTGVVPIILSEEHRIVRDAIPTGALSASLSSSSPILPDISLPNPYGNTPIGLGITVVDQPTLNKPLIGLGFSLDQNTGTITTNPTLMGGNPVMQRSLSEPQDRKKLVWGPFFAPLKSSPLLPLVKRGISVIENISVAKADGLHVPSPVVPAAVVLSATLPFTPLYTQPTPSPSIYGTLWDI